MDDVIFSGSGGRPARNTAEVMLTIDNGERTAPAAFNDADMLEISRRIEREEGSTYRINGKEVRARDVQILFADAATGARSPSLVRQGQISEIISAKPQSRRRILEDAAGIAGLHARRHEAELRLKAAEDNLLRVEDVLRELETQVDSLKRQGRQASRYKSLSAEIRRLEALLFAIGFADAREQAASSERQAAEDLKAVADRTEEQTSGSDRAGHRAHGLPALARSRSEGGSRPPAPYPCPQRARIRGAPSKERVTELERHIGDLNRDLAREAAQRTDAAGLDRAPASRGGEIALTTEGADDARADSEERLRVVETELARGRERR